LKGKAMIDSKYLIISVIGPHAHETENTIFKRKIEDINKVGKTFWLTKSHQSKPDMVQQFCLIGLREKLNVYCFFIEPSKIGGAIPTMEDKSAESFSADGKTWQKLPDGLGPVTGNINKNAYALVFDDLKMVTDSIDLWDYVNFFKPNEPLKIMQGGSTLCALKQENDFKNEIKSRYRKIVAVGRLATPYCVWLKLK
jgi:hypothetical protein